MGYRLGVDLGTTFTAAAVDDGSGPVMLGLGNRALQVPSVLFLKEDGTFLCGEAAERWAAADPTRAVREFKRRIGDTVPILVAGRPYSPQALTAELLAWIISAATERQGAAPDDVVVTHPANWGGYKRELLHQVLVLADVPAPKTCTEPEAAANQYAARAGLAPGTKLVVYDLGGGTFDVCTLEQHQGGFKIIGAPDGVEHLGGIDFDHALFSYVVGLLPGVDVLDPEDPQVAVGLARLRRDCVDAKEALSDAVETVIPVALPGLSTSVRLTRADVEALIASPLRATLDATARAMRSAGLDGSDLSVVVLVGGSSRIPLVGHLLQAEYGVPTAMDTHPKHDIALGAARHDLVNAVPARVDAVHAQVDAPARGADPPPSVDTLATVERPVLPSEVTAVEPTRAGGSPRPSRWRAVGLTGAVTVLLAAGTAYVLTRGAEDAAPATEAPSSSPTRPVSPSPTTSPTSVRCWTGALATAASACPVPTGRRGMAAVFSSFDDTCEPPDRIVTPGKIEAFDCPHDAFLARYSRWEPGADRFAHYRESNPGAVEARWTVGDRPAGTQWTSTSPDADPARRFQWSATYEDFPYSVSVEARTPADRSAGIAFVRARRPDRLGLR